MDPKIKEQTIDRLTRSESIQIIVDSKTGVDGIAAGLALYLSLEKLGKSISIAADSPTVGQAQTLYGVDRIGHSNGKKNLVVVIDNAVKKVEQVSYFLDDNKLKIVVHTLSGASKVDKDEISFEEQVSKPDIIISIGDVPDNLSTLDQKNSSSVMHINISRNPMVKNYVQFQLSHQDAASVSEIAVIFFQEMALPLDEDIAYNLYTGISTETNNFSPFATSYLSLQSALWLIKFGPGKANLAQGKQKQQEFNSNVASTPPQQMVKQEIQYNPDYQTQIEDVEQEKTQKEWLKPPKIYKGSKSFDTKY